jgi:type IV pilus assembly protein PilV
MADIPQPGPRRIGVDVPRGIMMQIFNLKLKKSQGFTIIEVLVSMVILAIGVLGLGVMQITSMQNTQSGQMRSQASILGYDMIDSMRTNIPSVTAGAYALNINAKDQVAPNCYGADADCSIGEMAISDIEHWRTSLAASLPSGRGSIVTSDLVDTTLVTVTIQWVDPYSAANGREQTIVLSELPK